MINLICSSRYRINRQQIKKIANELLAQNGVGTNITVNIIFVGRNKMKNISSQYKNENVALPVLSFSYDDKTPPADRENLLGEVLICYPQTVIMAAQRNKRVEETIISLLKHGIENLLK